MKEAKFYKKLTKKQVRCFLCSRRCLIVDGASGFCRVRKNIGGKLYSLVYGKAAAMNIDPIEKKPFFNFAPGSNNLSFSTVGCPFRCKFCCNYPLSIEWKDVYGEDMPPQKIVEEAVMSKVQGVGYTYVEPTIFAEYAIDTAKIARKARLYNIFVTDGYATPESAKEISKHIDAAVVDFKCSAHPLSYKKLSQIPTVEPIFEAIKEYNKNGVHLEISNVIVPKHGDQISHFKKLVRWIVDNVGPNTPFHIIRFFPTYKMLDVPNTPLEVLEKAYKVAKEEGLKYVYLGNVPGNVYESTFCPNDNSLLIDRHTGSTKIFMKKDCKCPKCGEKVHIGGKRWIPDHVWQA